MSLLARLVHLHLRSPLRGRTRVTLALAHRSPDLQCVRVEVHDARPLFLDLRDATNHDLFRDSPHRSPPWEWSVPAAMYQLARPGDVALDVGANRGLHAVVLASIVGPRGRVVCFEPNQALHPCLTRTVAATPWMSLLPTALSDEDGEAPLFVGENHELSSLGDWSARRHGGTTRSIPVDVRRLDRLVADGEVPRPDFIKIDVEGNELRVFRGARTLLDHEDAPVVLYEANVWAAPVATREPVSAATNYLLGLAHADYRCYFLWDWGLVTRMGPDQLVHGNIVAIPGARRSRWPALESGELAELTRPGS